MTRQPKDGGRPFLYVYDAHAAQYSYNLYGGGAAMEGRNLDEAAFVISVKDHRLLKYLALGAAAGVVGALALDISSDRALTGAIATSSIGTGPRHLETVGWPGLRLGRQPRPRTRPIDRLRQAEVEHFRRAVGSDFDVRGLEVAMDGALLVRGGASISER